MTDITLSSNGQVASMTFGSLGDMAAASWAIRHQGDVSLDKLANACELARNGWDDQLQAALDVAESAVQLSEAQVPSYRADTMVYDVTGDSVDIGRYLSGEPECMIDFPLQPTSVVGRIITLVIPVTFSGSVTDETYQDRGRVVTAFALALSRLGHACEIWIDRRNCAHSGKRETRIRTLVKGADDTLDPSRIMFALAHADVLRGLCWTLDSEWPSSHESAVQRTPTSPDPADYPEGAMVLPVLYSAVNVPDAADQLRSWLVQVGLAE